MVVAPTTAVPISTGLAVALKVLPAPSFSSRFSLASSKLVLKPKFFWISCLDAGNLLDSRELIDGLCVVGYWAIGINCDGHRPHSEKPKRHKAKGENSGCGHQSV